jgi:hypothetical protein
MHPVCCDDDGDDGDVGNGGDGDRDNDAAPSALRVAPPGPTSPRTTLHVRSPPRKSQEMRRACRAGRVATEHEPRVMERPRLSGTVGMIAKKGLIDSTWGIDPSSADFPCVLL